MNAKRLGCAFFALLACACSEGAAAPSPVDPQLAEHVILLHGLGRGADSMAPLAEHLVEAGYASHNLDYASRSMTPSESVAWLAQAIVDCCPEDGSPVHFVTHSLGGILVRARLEESAPRNLGRVVQIAPPNQGSEIVDTVGENPVFEGIMGPTAVTLGTGPDSFPRSIGPPTYELGVIAGSSSINPVGSALLPGPDDGAVTIEATRLDQATDFILLDANHTLIMQEDSVAHQVIAFLRDGHFDHPELDPAAERPASAP
jgi:triacylglycerol lipase